MELAWWRCSWCGHMGRGDLPALDPPRCRDCARIRRPAEVVCSCGERVEVGSRGPVPTGCAECGRRRSWERPAELTCPCGATYPLARKGPVPGECPECRRRTAARRYAASAKGRARLARYRRQQRDWQG